MGHPCACRDGGSGRARVPVGRFVGDDLGGPDGARGRYAPDVRRRCNRRPWLADIHGCVVRAERSDGADLRGGADVWLYLLHRLRVRRALWRGNCRTPSQHSTRDTHRGAADRRLLRADIMDRRRRDGSERGRLDSEGRGEPIAVHAGRQIPRSPSCGRHGAAAVHVDRGIVPGHPQRCDPLSVRTQSRSAVASAVRHVPSETLRAVERQRGDDGGEPGGRADHRRVAR